MVLLHFQDLSALEYVKISLSSQGFPYLAFFFAFSDFIIVLL